MHAVQIDNLRGVLGVRKIFKIRNEVIKELCGVEKGVNESISEYFTMVWSFGEVG